MKKFISLFIFSSLLISNVFAGEKDLYDFLWLDPDKSVYVLQNKIFEKKKSIYTDIGLISNLTSNFQDTIGGQFKLGYYFHEEWAIELNYMQYSNSDNAAYESVEIVSGLAPFVRRPLSSTSIFMIWSPFYGKINTFNQIFYFDWSFGLGTGQYIMESNLDTAQLKTRDVYKSETYTPVQLKTNFKFHLNRSVHLGIEYLNTNYQAGTPKNPNSKAWTNNNDIIFSIGASF